MSVLLALACLCVPTIAAAQTIAMSADAICLPVGRDGCFSGTVAEWSSVLAQTTPPIFGANLSPEFTALLWAEPQAQQKPPPVKPPAKPAPPPRAPATRATTPPTVGNPVAVEFEFLDHAQATGYEVDIVSQTTGVVQNTLQYGKTAAQPGTITIRLDVNVQPVAHGVYMFVARGKTATGTTPSSLPSDPWQRAPGPPGKPVAIGKPIP